METPIHYLRTVIMLILQSLAPGESAFQLVETLIRVSPNEICDYIVKLHNGSESPLVETLIGISTRGIADTPETMSPL